MKVIEGIPVWGDPDENTLRQAVTCNQSPVVEHVALMADAHVGYGVPIGGVIASQTHVSPTAVGYDIGCGNKAVLTDMPGHEVVRDIEMIMDDIWRKISFGVGRKNTTKVDGAIWDHAAWQIGAVERLKAKAQDQLGTVGSGNHYVDVMVDELGRTWVGVHFGSRGLGHGIATHYLTAGGAKDGMFVEPLWIDAQGSMGTEYLAAMELAGNYAYAGRDWVCAEVLRILGAKEMDSVHNHHNYSWVENHGGLNMHVARKGATPAWPRQRGFVGGSMGDDAVILEGVLDEEDFLGLNGPAIVTDNEYALFSTVHGAGRVMSRSAAKGKERATFIIDPQAAAEKTDLIRRIKGMAKGSPQRVEMGRRIDALGKIGRTEHQVVKPGRVSREEMNAWLSARNVTLRGADLDEAPQAYRRLDDVLMAQGATVRVLHRLRPIGVAMAGSDTYDPYKD